MWQLIGFYLGLGSVHPGRGRALGGSIKFTGQVMPQMSKSWCAMMIDMKRVMAGTPPIMGIGQCAAFMPMTK